MRWGVTIYGQPVSWDDAYRTGRMPVYRKVAGRRVQVLNDDGTPKMIHRPHLTDEASTYKDGVVMQAKPVIPRWTPSGGQIRVTVELHLAHNMDCDNATKLAFDGIVQALKLRGIKNALGKPVDDMQFVPCYQPKEIGSSDPRIILTFDDDVDRHR